MNVDVKVIKEGAMRAWWSESESGTWLCLHVSDGGGGVATISLSVGEAAVLAETIAIREKQE